MSHASTGAGAEPALTDVHVQRRVVSSTQRFHGRVWDIRTDVVDHGDGQQGARDLVAHHLARDLTEVAADERHIGVAEERDMLTRWVPLELARAGVLTGDLHSPLCVMGLLAAASVLID